MTRRLSHRVSLVLAAAAISMACSAVSERAIERVSRGELEVLLVESGEISAVSTRGISAPMEWRADLQIIDLAEEGSQVEAGDFLVAIDTGFLEAELEETQAKLETSITGRSGILAKQRSENQRLRNAVTTAEISYSQAELQIEKLRFESDSKRQEARLNLSKAHIALEEAEAKQAAQAILDSLELSKIELDIADARNFLGAVESKIDALTLVAPQPGLVIHAEYENDGRRIKARVGEKVPPGMTIIEIPDLSAMQVEFELNEVDRQSVTTDMPVRVSLEAFPERFFQGHIESIARLASPERENSTVKSFHVTARLHESDALLRPGMTAVVEIQIQRIEDATLVPLSAVFSRGGKTVVFPKGEWPQARSIEIEAYSEFFAATRSDLSEGMELVVVSSVEDMEIDLDDREPERREVSP